MTIGQAWEQLGREEMDLRLVSIWDTQENWNLVILIQFYRYKHLAITPKTIIDGKDTILFP